MCVGMRVMGCDADTFLAPALNLARTITLLLLMTLIPSLIFLLERTMAGCLCTACPIDILLTPAPHALNLHPPHTLPSSPILCLFLLPNSDASLQLLILCTEAKLLTDTKISLSKARQNDTQFLAFFNEQLLESVINNANKTVVALILSIRSMRWRHESRLPLCCTIQSENRRARLHKDLTWRSGDLFLSACMISPNRTLSQSHMKMSSVHVVRSACQQSYKQEHQH